MRERKMKAKSQMNPIFNNPQINYQTLKSKNSFTASLGFELFYTSPNYGTYFEGYSLTLDTVFTSEYEYKDKILAGLIGEISYKRLLKNKNIIKLGLNFRVTPFEFFTSKCTFPSYKGSQESTGTLTSNANYWGFSIGYEFRVNRRGKGMEIHF